MSRSTDHSIDPTENHLLACLPTKEIQLIKEVLEFVSLKTKDELNEVGTAVSFLHFPLDSGISLLDLQPTGRAVEVAVIGKEGCTGFTVMQGTLVSPCRILVQVGGSAYRLDVTKLRRLLPRMPVFRYALARFSGLILREAIIP